MNDQTDPTADPTGTTWVYTYDLGGNIQSKRAYVYTTSSIGSLTPTESHTYTYGNSGWKDQLTKHDGVTISYDAIGNPLSDGTWSHTWEHGKQLAQMQKTESGVTTTVSFEYNEDGLRTKKTATSTGVTEYTLHGKNIVHMTRGTDILHFYYDAQGKTSIVVFNGTAYGYLYNLQGDVVALVNTSGTKVVEYTYDAWGKPTSKTGSLAGTLGTVQPFRYRRYVFDEETGDYYLRSRYYRPSWGRFVNADALIMGNLYSYCECNPVIRTDSSGMSWLNDAAQFLIDVIDFVFPGSSERANKVLSGEADLFDYADWLTLGYASSVKGAVAPEKPLSVEHWVDSFTTIAVPFSLYTALAPKPLPKVSWPKVTNPLSDTQYKNKVLTQMKRDKFHGFPRLIDTLATDMDITTIIGGDGVRYTRIQMPGSMNLRDKVYEGVFEYLIGPDGWINHRFFRPN